MGHNHPKTDSQSTMFGVALIAAAVGAVVGLLFAPKRGTETRDDIVGKYKNMQTKARDTASTAKSKVGEGVDAARTKVHDATDRAKKEIDNAADEAKDTLDRTNMK